MELKTEKMKVKKILKKTTAQGVKEIKVGDVIQFELNTTGLMGYVEYADLIINNSVRLPTKYSVNTLKNIEQIFELEIVDSKKTTQDILEIIDNVLNDYDLELCDYLDRPEFEDSKDAGNTASIFGSVYFSLENSLNEYLNK